MVDNYRTNKASTSYFMDLLKSVAVSLIVTFIILLAAALMICFTDFPEKYTMASAIAGTILGVFIGSSMAAQKNPDRKMVSAILAAFIYAVIAYIIGCILQAKVAVTANTALFTLIALITGVLAALFSNRQKSTRKCKTGSPGFVDRLKKKRPGSYSFGKNKSL